MARLQDKDISQDSFGHHACMSDGDVVFAGDTTYILYVILIQR